MNCYRNDVTCAHYNLALEERIFNEHRGGDFFMLWRNKSAVIVGQNQIIENEVDVSYAEANGIQIVRRVHIIRIHYAKPGNAIGQGFIRFH